MGKKLMALLMLCALVLFVTACGANGEQGADSKKAVLTVGTSGDYPPFEFYMDTEEGRALVGADIKLAEYIAEKLDMELELVDMSFDGLLGSLAEGKFDLVISGMSVDPERKCLFSDPYMRAGQALLVPAGCEDKYASLDDLMGQKIGGQMGALQQDLAEQYAGVENAQIVANVQDMIMMVAEGKLDGMFCERVVAESAAAKSDQVVVANLEIPMEENLVAVCMAEGNTEMAEKINPIIAEVVEQNLYGEWMAQYLDVEQAAE